MMYFSGQFCYECAVFLGALVMNVVVMDWTLFHVVVELLTLPLTVMDMKALAEQQNVALSVGMTWALVESVGMARAAVAGQGEIVAVLVAG